MDLKKIFDNNEKWISQKLSKDNSYFDNLSKGQSPELLYIGCSDSRVVPEEMMGLTTGDLFVHRNIANIVNSIDPNASSVIDYAVGNLKVKDIIVCGHYGCGGIKAAIDDIQKRSLPAWFDNIQEVIHSNQTELDQIADKDLKYKRLVELNVLTQSKNLLKLDSVQKAFDQKLITIHAWVFDMSTGELIDLNYS
jgi:carbonic anhydrase